MGASDALSFLVARKPVDLVIDVGANAGQTGTALRAAGYRGPIVSFEPQSDAYTRLAERADADPAWTVRPEALGAEDGVATLHVTRNVGSSSLLQPTSWAQGAFKAVVPQARQQVEVARLARLFPQIRGAARWPVLKLDCQGSERAILSGGEQVLADIPYIVIEASVVELYAGETLLPEMLRIMAGYGYRPIDLRPGFRHPDSGDLLQVDVAFARETPVTGAAPVTGPLAPRTARS
jgi:FkbM family methyltransferase